MTEPRVFPAELIPKDCKHFVVPRPQSTTQFDPYFYIEDERSTTIKFDIVIQLKHVPPPWVPIVAAVAAEYHHVTGLRLARQAAQMPTGEEYMSLHMASKVAYDKADACRAWAEEAGK